MNFSFKFEAMLNILELLCCCSGCILKLLNFLKTMFNNIYLSRNLGALELLRVALKKQLSLIFKLNI